jgi:DNA processing protein
MESSRSDLRLYLRFHLASGIGPILFRRLVEAFGDMPALAEAGPRQWARVDGMGPKRAEAITAVTEDRIDDELAAAEAAAVRLYCWSDAGYPAALKSIYDCPPVVYIRGRVDKADAVAVGVVGSRRCSHYGLEQAGRFGQLLARAGFTVVSGGARGIDSAAHRGALAAGGRTVMVAGCGLDTTYPPENAELFEQIVQAGQGILLSELPMGTGVKGENFPKRNRIISGLSLGLLVVEAAPRSGALISARFAAEQNRVVFAIPGRVDSPASRGTNQLIREGAILVQNLDDMLEDLGEVGQEMSPEPEEMDRPAVMPDLSAPEARLVGAMGTEAMGLDELVRASGMSSAEVTSRMTILVLKGVIEQRPGNVFVRKKWVGRVEPG